MRTLFLCSILLFVICPSKAKAGAPPDGGIVAPVFADEANNWRVRTVMPSSMNWVCISTDPTGFVPLSGTPYKIGYWRYREIQNLADGDLMLAPSRDTFTIWTSSEGKHISSNTAGLFLGDKYVIPHQAEVWGKWQQGTSTATDSRGCTVTETWIKK